MIPLSKVTAVFVTRRMNQDLARIIASLPQFAAFMIYDNAVLPNRKVYGRYEAASWAPTELVYTQDDDCLVDPRPLLEAWRPGAIVCNMPADRREFYNDGITLLGWGAIFEKSLIAPAFDHYLKKFPTPDPDEADAQRRERCMQDDLFLRECDRVFTALTPTILVDVPYVNLPSANASNRMCAEDRHLADLAAIRTRIKELTT